MDVRVRMNEQTEKGRYFDACARIRGISTGALLNRLLTVIAKDQMVAAILDDEDKLRGPLKKHERPYREKRT